MIIHYLNRKEPKSHVKIKLHEDNIEFDMFFARIDLDSNTDYYNYGLDLTANWQSLDIIPEKGVFYTDANAYKIMKRDLNATRPYSMPKDSTSKVKQVSSYFYPINAGLFIEDKAFKEQMLVMNDRPQGGSAYHEGRIELMFHRLGKTSDNLGVGEPIIDETPDTKGANVSVKFYLSFTQTRE